MQLYRLTDPAYAVSDALRDHARGSLVVDGRWHDRTQMDPAGGLIYTSVSASLSANEKLVHIGPEQIRKHDFALITYEATLAPELTTAALAADLPPDWHNPLGCPDCARAGSAWYAAGTGVFLIVPSVTLPLGVYDPAALTEMRHGNVLINTRHPQVDAHVRKVSVQPFRYDPQLARG